MQRTASPPSAANGNLPLSVYVHWPYCRARCPYCDFNAHVADYTTAEPEYVNALLAELAWHRQRMGQRTVTTVFFGGGTPSLMQPASVEKVLGAVAEQFTLMPNAEITLEANPTSSDRRKFQEFRNAGVNRLSLGVQALCDDDLKFLGREHSAAEARCAIEHAAAVFHRYSFDLIYARHAQHTVSQWQQELRAALELGGGHISAYALTIEPNTPFAIRFAGGSLSRPSEDTAADFLLATTEQCSKAGYRAYEVSNFASEGQECLHNLAYWRYQEFLGIGAGAHSRINVGGAVEARGNIKPPKQYTRSVSQGGGAAGHSSELLSPYQQALEMLLNGMRLAEGVDATAITQRTGFSLPRETIDMLAKSGMIWRGNDYSRIGASSKGTVVLDTVIGELVASWQPH